MTIEAETIAPARKILTLKFGENTTVRVPERKGVIIPAKGKVSVGRVVEVTRKPPRLKPRAAQTEADDVFSGVSGGSQRHIRRPKK